MQTGGKSDGATWSVVAVVNETPQVIRRFVSWYLAAGATKIFLFFDNPDDPSIQMVEHLDKVVAEPCTKDFWGKLDVDPSDRFTRRQNRACRHGYNSAPEGWVLNVDADELIFLREGSIADLLAVQSDETRTVLVRPAEEVVPPHDTGALWFRRPMSRYAVQAVYGDIAGLVIRNHGMVGHSLGKSFIRTGLGRFRMRQHAPMFRGVQIVDKTLGAEDGIELLHFHNRGYDDWRRKLDYRLTNVGFRPRMRNALLAARDQGEPALKALFYRLYGVDKTQSTAMLDAGVLQMRDLDFQKIEREFFGADPAIEAGQGT